MPESFCCCMKEVVTTQRQAQLYLLYVHCAGIGLHCGASPTCLSAAQAASGTTASPAAQALAAQERQAQLAVQVAAAQDQIRFVKRRMHETGQVIGNLLEMASSR